MHIGAAESHLHAIGIRVIFTQKDYRPGPHVKERGTQVSAVTAYTMTVHVPPRLQARWESDKWGIYRSIIHRATEPCAAGAAVNIFMDDDLNQAVHASTTPGAIPAIVEALRELSLVTPLRVGLLDSGIVLQGVTPAFAEAVCEHATLLELCGSQPMVRVNAAPLPLLKATPTDSMFD